MSIKGQGHSLTFVKGHSEFKVKCLTFGLYNQVSDSGPQGPLVKLLFQEKCCGQVVRNARLQSRRLLNLGSGKFLSAQQ